VVVQGYGMTETTALVSLNHPFHSAGGTVGQVLPGREVKLSSEGEVLVRGSTVAQSFWQGGKLQTTAGDWLATGDLAEFDEGGNLRFRGRKKDLIVTASGLNIYPEDLESAVQRQTGVKACAVIEAEGSAGPEPVAVLVLSPGTLPGSVVDAANAQLADFQQIRRWQVWPEPDLPRTSTGKIKKRDIVLAPAAQQGERLDLDSLGRVELQARVESQYGVTLSDDDLSRLRTSADLNQLIQRGSAPEDKDPHRYWKWPWQWWMQAIRSIFLEAIAFPLLHFLAKPSFPRKPTTLPAGPVLLIANHITSYDPPFVLGALPVRMRTRTAIAMSGEMLLDYRRNNVHPLSGIAYWLITALFNVYPLPRSVGFRQSFRHAGEAVDRGYNVLVFPEGLRTEDGKPQPFRKGIGLLWKELGIPVVPVLITGLGELKVSGERWFRSGKIAVLVGDPLVLPPLASTEDLTDLLWHAVFDLDQRP
jgi:long-chain acyl-CoA synthetase